MLETVLLILFCLCLGLFSLAVILWLIITGGILSLDNMLLTVISLTMGVIFAGIFAWSVHSGEFQEALRSLRKGSSKTDNPGGATRQNA